MKTASATSNPGERLLALFVIFAFGAGVATLANAQLTVYKCLEEDGSTTFSDLPCSEAPDVMNIDESHTPSPPRTYAQPQTFSAPTRANAESTQQSRNQEQKTPMSYRCSTSTGEVWYRHQRCPQTITVQEVESVSGRTFDGERVTGTATIDREVIVTQQEIPRTRACSEIYAVSSNRRGARRDQKYDTYQRNTGADPCR